MKQTIINELSKTLNINASSIEATIKLLESDNTVPFIARYRKEVTNSLDEEQIKNISDRYNYEVNLFKRKEDVIRLIDEKGLLTDELKQNILNSQKLVDVEDLYRPYKEKKKTKATEAIKLGLEPLSKYILAYNDNVFLEANKYISDKVKTAEEAVNQAKYIIAELISDEAKYRKFLRTKIISEGIISSKKKKDAVDIKKTYEIYYDFEEKINNIKPHRILAINRAETENVINVNIIINQDQIIDYICNDYIKNKNSECGIIIKEAIEDAYKRLIFPSVGREIRSDLKDFGEDAAINNFSLNLEHLLLTPPIKEKVVMGFDPAFRTGCKLAVVDASGKLLDIAVIYPTEPHNQLETSRKTMIDIINKYHVEIIAIGNGTASRESEKFVSSIISDFSHRVEFVIVNEAGASVYSASEEAINEFPELTVEKRSAISIARRLQDALSELVKIDPKSIGVGLYQHDVKEKKLDESLNFVVEKVVNQVGVNINTASKAILNYISGINSKIAAEIIKYREKNGKFNSRNDIKKVKGFNDKVFEQSAGFLKIINSINPLDASFIHPESYDDAKRILSAIDCNENDIGTEKIIFQIQNTNPNDLAQQLNIDKIKIADILLSLKKPNLDPRDNMPKVMLKSNVLKIEDLSIGMELNGVVRNVVDFGAFIDIGLHNDGLVHISKICNHYINHPSEVISVGDIVTCYVIDISIEKEKVSLSLISDEKKDN